MDCGRHGDFKVVYGSTYAKGECGMILGRLLWREEKCVESFGERGSSHELELGQGG